ncbi:hypothetical protein TIFTF001_001908 [Ficus carica]|uniref:Uncharacterized protein n=1 Tax=Ficus carica TaxID=3494 RepID=A0AA87Z941_FICCA|nr:hypothetical protein TIFTF001_001908 [Ficus carica]
MRVTTAPLSHVTGPCLAGPYGSQSLVRISPPHHNRNQVSPSRHIRVNPHEIASGNRPLTV